jgi:hypothetical protein
MSSFYHTPYAYRTALTAALMNVPLGQLDETIDDILAGEIDFSKLYVGSGAIDAAAALQVDSTTKGFLPPRMTTAQRNAIVSPPEGLWIHNTNHQALNYYNGSTWFMVGNSSGALTKVISFATMTNSGGNNFSGPFGNYQDLILRLRVRSTVAAVTDSIRIRFNGDSGAANYAWTQFYGASSISSANDSSDDGIDIICPGASATAGRFLEIEFRIFNFREATNKISGFYRGVLAENTMYSTWGAFEWIGGAAITSFEFAALAGNMNGSYAGYALGVP